MRVARTISLVILVVVTAGCATHHRARAGGFPEGVLAGRRSVGTVAIGNAQTANKFVKIGSAGMGRSLYGDLSQWTDAAIELLAEKLTASGMTVSNASSRKLTLAITDARMSSAGGGWGFKCAVTLSVEGANGLKATFVGERGSWKYPRVCDAGISEAVANMLRDDTVLAYLGYCPEGARCHASRGTSRRSCRHEASPQMPRVRAQEPPEALAASVLPARR